MGTITTRRRAGGRTVYAAEIRIKRAGKVIHQTTRTFDKKADARAWMTREEARLQTAEDGGHNKATVGEIIGRYVQEFGEIGAWSRSKHADLKRLQGFAIAEIQATRLTSSDLVEHIRLRRKGGTGPATALNDLVWLRVVWKTARPAWGIPLDVQVIDDALTVCRANKMVHRPDHRDRRPTRQELDQLLGYFQGAPRSDVPMAEIMLFAMFSARRQEEITRLSWAGYDKKRRTILVTDMKDPWRKDGNDVVVFLTPEAAAIIDRQPKDGDLIFPYNPKTISAYFTRACKLLDIQGLRFHDLRHECTSWLFELGWEIPRVAQVTGHRTWQNLQRYAHLREHGQHDKYKAWVWRPDYRSNRPQASSNP